MSSFPGHPPKAPDQNRPDNLQDTLVVAIANHVLDELKEVTS